MKTSHATYELHTAARMELLKEILEDLDNTHSLPLLMYYRGYEPQEIACKLDIPVDAVSERLFEARRSVWRQIKNHYT